MNSKNSQKLACITPEVSEQYAQYAFIVMQLVLIWLLSGEPHQENIPVCGTTESNRNIHTYISLCKNKYLKMVYPSIASYFLYDTECKLFWRDMEL